MRKMRKIKRIKTKRIKTKRLILRPFETTDLKDFYEYCKNPAVGLNAGWKPHESLNESYVVLLSFIKSGGIWALTERGSDKVIGSVGVHFDDFDKSPKVKMVGYALAQEYWGRGYMTEAVDAVIRYAFKKLKLKKLTIYHFTDNLRSKRVIEKSGFKFIKELKAHYKMFDGTLRDELYYELSAEDYLPRN